MKIHCEFPNTKVIMDHFKSHIYIAVSIKSMKIANDKKYNIIKLKCDKMEFRYKFNFDKPFSKFRATSNSKEILL